MKRDRRSVVKGLVLLIGLALLMTAGPSMAGNRDAHYGELQRVTEDPALVWIDGERYPLATGVRILSPERHTMSMDDLGSYQNEMVVFKTRYAARGDEVVEIWVQGPSDD